MRNEVVIDKMISYAKKILEYSSGLDYEGFVNNSMIVDVCVFNLNQIGELTSGIDEQFEKEHTQFHGGKCYGLRNRIIHDYEGVNLSLVWEIVSEDIPDLLSKLISIQNEIDA